jgi:hypothetical protein
LTGGGRIDVDKLMKLSRASFVLLFIALVLASGLSCINGRSSGTKVNFLRDWEVAKDQADSEGKPIMINFYTDT